MTIPPPQIAYHTPYSAPAPPRGGLVGFGVLMIVMGAFTGLMALLIPLALLMSRAIPAPAGMAAQSQMDLRQAIAGLVTYAAVAVVFIWTGVGSIRCRRWVRPIMQVVGWTWLLVGLASVVMFTAMLPSLYQTANMGAAGGMSATPMIIIGAFTLIFLLAFYVALPGVLIWFYRRPSVQQTLDFYDPGPAWTDRCPTQALGVSLGMWATAGMMLAALLYNVVPAFGVLLTGVPAAVAILAVAAASAYCGWTTFQLRPVGWWASTLLIVVLTVSAAMTFARVDLVEFYRLAGMGEAELMAIGNTGTHYQAAVVAVTLVFGLLCVGYMFYVRRHFTGRPPEPAPAAVLAAPAAVAWPASPPPPTSPPL